MAAFESVNKKEEKEKKFSKVHILEMTNVISISRWELPQQNWPRSDIKITKLQMDETCLIEYILYAVHFFAFELSTSLALNIS